MGQSQFLTTIRTDIGGLPSRHEAKRAGLIISRKELQPVISKLLQVRQKFVDLAPQFVEAENLIRSGYNKVSGKFTPIQRDDLRKRFWTDTLNPGQVKPLEVIFSGSNTFSTLRVKPNGEMSVEMYPKGNYGNYKDKKEITLRSDKHIRKVLVQLINGDRIFPNLGNNDEVSITGHGGLGRRVPVLLTQRKGAGNNTQVWNKAVYALDQTISATEKRLLSDLGILKEVSGQLK